MISAIDFTYCGETLSSHGFIIGSIDDNNTEKGNFANINVQTKRPSGSTKDIIHAKTYGDSITFSFQIVKGTGEELTKTEISTMKRWLERGSYNWLRFDNEDIYYNAFFTVGYLKIGNIIYGFDVTVTNDSSFAYSEEKTKTVTSSSAITNNSDLVGYISPVLEITCSGGNASITNTFDGAVLSTTTIDNCASGEVITIDCEAKTILTSNNSHKSSIATDFNYVFMKLANDYSTRTNTIATTKCSVTIKYREIRMVVI